MLSLSPKYYYLDSCMIPIMLLRNRRVMYLCFRIDSVVTRLPTSLCDVQWSKLELRRSHTLRSVFGVTSSLAQRLMASLNVKFD